MTPRQLYTMVRSAGRFKKRISNTTDGTPQEPVTYTTEQLESARERLQRVAAERAQRQTNGKES
jgi:hypothetical protein